MSPRFMPIISSGDPFQFSHVWYEFGGQIYSLTHGYGIVG